jgi:hypothetical protein
MGAPLEPLRVIATSLAIGTIRSITTRMGMGMGMGMHMGMGMGMGMGMSMPTGIGMATSTSVSTSTSMGRAAGITAITSIILATRGPRSSRSSSACWPRTTSSRSETGVGFRGVAFWH